MAIAETVKNYLTQKEARDHEYLVFGTVTTAMMIEG